MILAALALAATPTPPLPSRERVGAPQAREGEGAQVAAIDRVIRASNLAGEVLVAKGDRILLDRAYGTVAPGGGSRHKVGASWRLASITKQVTAVSVMRMVERGDLLLDGPLDSSDPALKGITVRMLLQHHSGLANPDDTPAATGQMPAFYRAVRPDLRYCSSKIGTPGAPFAYNNCDYLVLGERLEAGEGEAGEIDNALIPGTYGGQTVPGFVGGKAEPKFNLMTFGAAGALTGTARSVFAFDRQLMTGKLLKPAALAELWKPEGRGSYQALGQWVFPGKLAGCAAPKRIVQRDGEIQGVQTRNFIFPDDDLVVIVFTNRSSDDFKFGEVWEGKGFTYDLLSAAACGLRPN